MAKKRRIRPIALCVFRRGDQILVYRGFDAVAGVWFCRPLGGGIELGEHSRDTILREIREELGAVVTNLVPLGVVESIFMYLGKQRHEIVFVYDGQFEDASLYDRELLSVVEGDDCFEAQWRSLSDFQQGIERLVPEQLLEVLTSYQGHGYAWR